MTRAEFASTAFTYAPQDQREREIDRTRAAIVALLEEPGRQSFPYFYVVADGEEVRWAACDLALHRARQARGEGTIWHRWLAELGQARKDAAREEQRALAAGYGFGGAPPASREERKILDSLVAPLFVTATKRQAEAA